MEIQLSVPRGTNIEVAIREYPDIYGDSWDDGTDEYWLGGSSDEDLDDGDSEWLSYEEAVEACGFLDGAFPSGSTMIEGNGPWAQGMISQKDFSRYAISDSEKALRGRVSEIYWWAHRRGAAAAKAIQQERRSRVFA